MVAPGIQAALFTAVGIAVHAAYFVVKIIILVIKIYFNQNMISPNKIIEYYSRPTGSIRDEIVSITEELTNKWFTSNVPMDTFKDITFQDIIILKQADRIISFIMYTCMDGSIQITLIGTRLEYHSKGYGSILINKFFEYVKSIGFNRIIVWTVPPDKKPSYTSTLAFYEKNGFRLMKRYNELWECGALQLVKELS